MPLPGPSARFDYQDVDPAAHRLFVAHLGGHRIDVVDLAQLRVVGTIAGVGQVHGVRVAPGIDRLYASATADNEVATFEESTLRLIGRAHAAGYPDGIAYAPSAGKVYVSNELGGSETVLDARTGDGVGTIRLGGQAGNVAYDASSGRVYVAVQTQNVLAEIDPASDRVVGSVHLPGCRHSHGLSVDADASLAFVACDENARLVIVDLARKRPIARYPVGSRPDVLAFDPGLHRLYVAAESGNVVVFQEAARSLRRLGLGKVAADAHSVAVDPSSHAVFFPLPRGRGGGPVLRVMAPT